MFRPKLGARMGEIHIPVTFRAVGGSESYTADSLVDTGATNCIVSASELRRIGVEPVGKARYELADGKVRKLAYGIAAIEMLGRTQAATVVFGPDDLEPCIGHLALQGAGAKIDEKTHTITVRRALRL